MLEYSGELDRVSLRTMASGVGRPVRGRRPRDVIYPTQTLAALGANATALGASKDHEHESAADTHHRVPVTRRMV